MAEEISCILQVAVLGAARNGYRNMYPFIFAGRDGRNAAYNPAVLRDADIDELVLTPARINLHSPCRPIFEKCCSAGNPSALYIEGLRLVAQGGLLPDAIQMLRSAAKYLKTAIFAASLVQICMGDLEGASTTLAPLCAGHPPGRPLYTWGDLEEAESITKMMFSQVKVLGPGKSGRFTKSWSYPTPECQMFCEKDNCDCIVHCYETLGCTKCFFHQKSFIMCQMI